MSVIHFIHWNLSGRNDMARTTFYSLCVKVFNSRNAFFIRIYSLSSILNTALDCAIHAIKNSYAKKNNELDIVKL